MLSNASVSVLFAMTLLPVTAACTHCDCSKEQTYALSLSNEEANDSEVIDLKKCQYGASSCISGKTTEGKPYRFGFAGNPNVLVGNIGDVKHELNLAKDQVESYGNGILEMPFINNDTGVMVIVNWSSKKQKFIGHDFNVAGQD